MWRGRHKWWANEVKKYGLARKWQNNCNSTKKKQENQKIWTNKQYHTTSHHMAPLGTVNCSILFDKRNGKLNYSTTISPFKSNFDCFHFPPFPSIHSVCRMICRHGDVSCAWWTHIGWLAVWLASRRTAHSLKDYNLINNVLDRLENIGVIWHVSQ